MDGRRINLYLSTKKNPRHKYINLTHDRARKKRYIAFKSFVICWTAEVYPHNIQRETYHCRRNFS